MVQEIKNNPILSVVLGLLLAAVSVIGLMNKSHLDNLQANMNHSFDQLWSKLDRVTVFMHQKEESFRADHRVLKEEMICIGKEVERLKTKYEVNNNRIKK